MGGRFRSRDTPENRLLLRSAATHCSRGDSVSSAYPSRCALEFPLAACDPALRASQAYPPRWHKHAPQGLSPGPAPEGAPGGSPGGAGGAPGARRARPGRGAPGAEISAPAGPPAGGPPGGPPGAPRDPDFGLPGGKTVGDKETPKIGLFWRFSHFWAKMGLFREGF